MANDASTPNNNSDSSPEPKLTTISMGMDWDSGMVHIQSSTENPLDPDHPTITVLQIPAQSFVEAGISVGLQLLQRVQEQAASKKPKLIIPRPGDLRRLQ